MPVLLVSLRLLRRTGCSLPVEVFIPTFDGYEPKLCEKVLPSLNAKCVMLADDLLNVADPEGKQELAAYQIKPFVLLLSSFNEVLFLDADNFPVTDPELLFSSRPFLDTGLIIWPDLWCASQSPFFYSITGAPETPLREHPSSESGQIMYDKTRHIEDLLLACYYSYYGPGLWYPMLSQGYPGEGDKETYLRRRSRIEREFLPTASSPRHAGPRRRHRLCYPTGQSGTDDYTAMKDGRRLDAVWICHMHSSIIITRASMLWAS